MKMIPHYINKTISNAERKMFGFVKDSDDLPNWYCLHSLGLSKHMYKREGEIDILLVGPDGIFVVEVKGGRVRREQGVWKFTDRYGRVSTKKESPFVQARSAMYSLRSDLSQQFGNNMNQYLFGYGVALPDITFKTESPEWDLQTVFDVRDVEAPFSEYLTRLVGSWKSRQRVAKPITKKEINEIVTYFRGDFETVCPISVEISDSEAEILKLTDEQLNSLDALSENRRVIFHGPAGTGKTLIAAEQAKRNEAQGIKTLFLCYNKFLAAFMEESLNKEGRLEYIDIKTIHGFFHDVIKNSGLGNELNLRSKTVSTNDLFQVVYPELFLKAWGEDKYQALIVDEAQDVLTTRYIDCLEHLIDGGMDNGNWSIFLDPENQKNMFLNLDDKAFEKLKERAVSFGLSINCRNTKPIAIQTEIITGIETAKVKNIEGIPVQYIWYDDDTDQSIKVTDSVNKLLDGGVKPGDITILSPKRYSSSVAGSGKLRLKKSVYHLDSENIRNERGDKIAYTSIQSYKGLEGSVVVITDIDELDGEWDRVVNYVGFTRARTALIVAIQSSLKSDYMSKLKALRK